MALVLVPAHAAEGDLEVAIAVLKVRHLDKKATIAHMEPLSVSAKDITNTTNLLGEVCCMSALGA